MSEMVTGTAHVTNYGHGRATRKGKGDRRDGRRATLDGASGGKQVQREVRGGENRVGDGVEGARSVLRSHCGTYVSRL
jgi:hypothetical protein